MSLHKHTLTHRKKINSATYSLSCSLILYLCEEVLCSWRQLNQQEKPHVTFQPFPFGCEGIVRELFEGQKTGHSTGETVFEIEEKVHFCV